MPDQPARSLKSYGYEALGKIALLALFIWLIIALAEGIERVDRWHWTSGPTMQDHCE